MQDQSIPIWKSSRLTRRYFIKQTPNIVQVIVIQALGILHPFRKAKKKSVQTRNIPHVWITVSIFGILLLGPFHRTFRTALPPSITVWLFTIAPMATLRFTLKAYMVMKPRNTINNNMKRFGIPPPQQQPGSIVLVSPFEQTSETVFCRFSRNNRYR